MFTLLLLFPVNGLKNAFVLLHVSRFQQILGVFTIQTATEALKVSLLYLKHIRYQTSDISLYRNNKCLCIKNKKPKIYWISKESNPL